MSDKNQAKEMVGESLSITFNQDYTSLSVVGPTGYRLFCLASVNQVDEIFNSHDEDIKIAERLFSSSLVAVVTTAESTKLKVCHFKKGTEICNYNYPSEILAVRLNRTRMVISLANSLYVHNIRDMKLLAPIHHKGVNPNGLCALSLNSQLAYPVSSLVSGELQIYDCTTAKRRQRIRAHESTLAALSFSSNGLLLATASEKGTVIRVFCVTNGQRVHEFRRGVKRYVNIASLNFSSCAQYLSVSSNTETVHVFRIDPNAVETAELQATSSAVTESVGEDADAADADLESTEDSNDVTRGGDESRWTMGYITKAMTSYFPVQVSDVLNQDRAFASVQLSQAGLRHECCITKLEKETRLVVACEDGFLYIYGLDEVRGGECKLLRVHDLRNPLYGITELNFDNPTSMVDGCKSNRSSLSQTVVTVPGSYARVVRDALPMTESDTLRVLHDAIDPPHNIFSGVDFPSVTESVSAGATVGCVVAD